MSAEASINSENNGPARSGWRTFRIASADIFAVDVTPSLDTAPAGTSRAQLDRIGQRRARIAPEAALADFRLDAGLAWEASPLKSYFRYPRRTGERAARQQLPALLARLQAVGLARHPALPSMAADLLRMPDPVPGVRHNTTRHGETP